MELIKPMKDKKMKRMMGLSYGIQISLLIFLIYSVISGIMSTKNHAIIAGIMCFIALPLLIGNIILIYTMHNREKNLLENELEEKLSYIEAQEIRFRDVLSRMQEPVMIMHHQEIVFLNKAFEDIIVKITNNSEEAESSIEFFRGQIRAYIDKWSKEDNKLNKSHFEMKLSTQRGEVIEVSAYLSKILWKQNICDYILIKETTQELKELRRAAQFQTNQIKKPFGLEKYLETKAIYVPYYVVSGDFYYLKKIAENQVVGILGDVMGKGISAALFNSAMKILFEESLESSKEPAEILNYINNEIGKYLDDNYVAALCFKFDFENDMVSISSAGINEFVVAKKDGQISKKINRGAFLGMFDDANFEVFISEIEPKDQYFFYTDGLESVFANTELITQVFMQNGLEDRMNYLQRTLPISRDKRKDDCTCLGFEIK